MFEKAIEKPGKCPKCGNITLYHNKGISQKNNRPFENYKCRCGYLEWVAQNKPQAGALQSPTEAQPSQMTLQAIGDILGDIDRNVKAIKDALTDQGVMGGDYTGIL